jgi:hypothetical protein
MNAIAFLPIVLIALGVGLFVGILLGYLSHR